MRILTMNAVSMIAYNKSVHNITPVTYRVCHIPRLQVPVDKIVYVDKPIEIERIKEVSCVKARKNVCLCA